MSKILYPKQARTFEEQVNLLARRGLIFRDEQQAIQDLTNFGYYHLSAYWYPYRAKRNNEIIDDFIPQTSWDQIIDLYEFDRQLRLLVLDAIERVEVAVRTKITYELSHKYGAFGYLDKENFNPNFISPPEHSKRHKLSYADWCKNTKKVVRRSKDVFIKHFFFKYEDEDPPLWMVTELISLGSLSKLYQGLELKDREIIAYYFKISPKKLSNWLHIITYIRNICAHHGRLWNRDLTIKGRMKDKEFLTPAVKNNKIFSVLLILRYLMKHLNNGNDWQQQVNQLIAQFPDANKLTAMGLEENWQEHPQWQ